jgi:hypothetical protein
VNTIVGTIVKKDDPVDGFEPIHCPFKRNLPLPYIVVLPVSSKSRPSQEAGITQPCIGSVNICLGEERDDEVSGEPD